jgi:hypothetical protein
MKISHKIPALLSSKVSLCFAMLKNLSSSCRSRDLFTMIIIGGHILKLLIDLLILNEFNVLLKTGFNAMTTVCSIVSSEQ